MFCLICRHGLPRIVSPPTSVSGLGSVISTPVSIIPGLGSVISTPVSIIPVLGSVISTPVSIIPVLGSVISTPVSIIPVLGSVIPAKAGIQRPAFDPHSQGHLPLALGKGTATIPCASALVRLPCILRMCISIRNSRDQT